MEYLSASIFFYGVTQSCATKINSTVIKVAWYSAIAVCSIIGCILCFIAGTSESRKFHIHIYPLPSINNMACEPAGAGDVGTTQSRTSVSETMVWYGMVYVD